jgi:hypothetical protein
MSSKAPAAYIAPFEFSNDIELLDVVMSLFSRSVLKKEISYKEKVVLREYMINGYSPNTKKAIRLSLDIKETNLNTLNCTLQKKGFLRPHPTNQRLKLLNEDLLKIRDMFLGESERKMFIVEFIKK